MPRTHLTMRMTISCSRGGKEPCGAIVRAFPPPRGDWVRWHHSRSCRPRRPEDPSMIQPTTPPNPLLQDWNAPYGLPPFGQLRSEHFEPAFEAAMREHRAELDAIARQAEPPDFDNTRGRVRPQRAGCWRASRRSSTTSRASATSPALQAVQREMAAPLAAHANAVYMHARALRAHRRAARASAPRSGLDRRAAPPARARAPGLRACRRAPRAGARRRATRR